ncbi:MAG: ArsR family transcriptional regulator [Verrucomicrobia bacterium]|nr:ArsR family transcriptional regulator [Verrucomicrobiota bacterium]
MKLLWLLLDTGELSVRDLALESEMTQPNASIQLKTLRAAGLIRFRREKMSVIYRVEADERVECAEALVSALRKCCKRSVSFESVIRQATAYTHERRIEIVQALNNGPLSYNQLLDQSGMNSSALSRHLRKLTVRGVVRRENDVYRIVRPADPFGRVLLRLARSC